MGDRLGIHGAVDILLQQNWIVSRRILEAEYLLEIIPVIWTSVLLSHWPGPVRVSVMWWVPISPVRWPAVIGTELAEISAFLPYLHLQTHSTQVWGPRRVGLRPERGKLRLRRSSLTSIEGQMRKWTLWINLPWAAFGDSQSLSKTTKLILLDSLLQEVCIKSALAGRSPLSPLRLSVCLCQSQTVFIQD